MSSLTRAPLENNSTLGTTLELLCSTPTPTVANAIDLARVRPPQEGFADASLICRFPGLGIMAGHAVTATFRSAASPEQPANFYDTIERLAAAIEQSPKPAVVVMQDVDEPRCGATFGELMAQAFKGFGASGYVTNGAVRDLDEIEALGLPVFSTGVVCAKACAHLLEIQQTVSVCGVQIHPGDFVHGDRNGLLVLPPQHLKAAAARIIDVNESEAELLNYFRDSVPPTLQGFALARQRCRDRQLRGS